jgi:hypothetical protein
LDTWRWESLGICGDCRNLSRLHASLKYKEVPRVCRARRFTRPVSFSTFEPSFFVGSNVKSKKNSRSNWKLLQYVCKLRKTFMQYNLQIMFSTNWQLCQKKIVSTFIN